jgi:HEAT repeat protein
MTVARLRSIGAPVVKWLRHPTVRERIEMLSKAMVVLAALLYPTWLIHVHFIYAHLPYRSLSVAVAFLIMQGFTIITQLVISFAIKRRREELAVRARRTSPAIRDALAAHLAGEDRTAELRRMKKLRATQVEVCVAEALTTVRGYGQERIGALARDLGLEEAWKLRVKSRYMERRKEAVTFLGLLRDPNLRPILEERLIDPDQLVRAASCRALLDLPGFDGAAGIFRYATSGPLLLRAMVAGDLGRHCPELPAGDLGVPARRELGRGGIVPALNVMAAWQRSVMAPQVMGLTVDPQPEVRAAAIRTLAFVESGGDTESLLLAALDDPDGDTRAAALFACARRGMRSAIDGAERNLRSSHQPCAEAACTALASFGEEGWRVLEKYVLDPRRWLAAKAIEALAAAQTGIRPIPELR